MFNSKKTATEVSPVETIIGKNTEIKGNISTQGTLRVDGRVEGDINSSGDVIIGETGVVAAQIKGRNVKIAGSVTGNIEAGNGLELLSTAKFIGDIKVNALIIEEGSYFKGTSEMKPAENIKTNAKVQEIPKNK